MKRIVILAAAFFAICACSPKIYDEANATLDKKVFAEQYKLNKAEWDAAFKFLADPATKTLAPGRYNLTENTYANVEIGRTRTRSAWEAHRKRIDLFMTIEGAELVNVCNLDELRDMTKPYTEDSDVENYRSSSNPRPVVLTPGKYIVLFPSDAHQPMLSPDGTSSSIHKVVIKIPFVKK